MSTNKLYDYMLPTSNVLYSSWEYGAVFATDLESAKEIVKTKLRADFEEVNRAISKLGKRIDYDFDSVIITEQGN